MNGRWWLAPLLVAVMVDGAVVVHHAAAPSAAINRATQRSTRSGECREAVLLDTAGVQQVDVVDAWDAQGRVYTQQGSVMFAGGATLAAESVRSIELGEDLGPVTASTPGVPMSMATYYQQQVGQGISWITGTCVPMVNPFQSGMRRVGLLSVANEPYELFHGRIAVNRGGGQALIPDAEVWIATGGDGRLGFAVLRPTQPVPVGDLTTVAVLYMYPTERLASMEKHETVKQIEAFYRDLYGHLQAALQATKPPAGSI